MESSGIHKSDIPFLHKAKATRFAAVLMLACWCSAAFDPEFRHALPGLIDGVIGVICGLAFGLLGWKLALPHISKVYRLASGDFFKQQYIGYRSPAHIIFALSFFAGTALAMGSRLLIISHWNLGWPWCRGNEFAPGSAIAFFVTFFPTNLIKHSRWYDSLPD